MKYCRRTALGIAGAIALFLLPGSALAQDGNGTPTILVPVQVLSRISVILNEILGYFVQGNGVTDPAGKDLAHSIATIFQQLADIFAGILSIF